MRTIKQVLAVLFAVLLVATIFTYFYKGSSDRKVPPKISGPEGILEVSSSDTAAALLEGITAYDEQDGDLTAHVVISGISKLISNDTAKVSYMVFDSDDNMAVYTRQIRYTDYHCPTFEIVRPLMYSSTEDVSLLDRIIATDVVDGDISHKIRVSTLEATNNSEVYNISIQVSNSIGDTVWQKLPVILLENDPLRPEIKLTEYLIYREVGTKVNPEEFVDEIVLPVGDVDMNNLRIKNEVVSSEEGTYYITYTYTANGSHGTAILTVVLQ